MTRMKRLKCLIGIDEVGRGPIAGPVAVGAFVFLDPKAAKLFRGVKESKQLSEQRREEWFRAIEKAQKAGLVDFAVSFQSNKVIDSKGISYAIRTALARSLDSVSSKPANSSKSPNVNPDARHGNATTANSLVLLDGGLKAPPNYKNQKTIIKGDEKEMTIALASICAKVLRDRRMNLLGKKYPKYGFEKHKGYGTKEHYNAIKKYGLLSIHRKNFLRLILHFDL